MAGFTTGEAIAVELPVARIPTRAAAYGIDVATQLALLGVLTPLVARTGELMPAMMTITTVVVLVGYPTTLETLTHGRTLGKLTLGLRVIRGDGGPITVRHALIRGLAGATVDFWGVGAVGLVGIVTSLCSPRARRVGDVLADTVVVHARARIPAPALASPPPWLAGWAAQLDVRPLPDDLAAAMRRYLLRLAELTPAAQDRIGSELVAAVAARLAVPMPPNWPPAQVLGAVLAERQRRDLMPVQPVSALPRG